MSINHFIIGHDIKHFLFVTDHMIGYRYHQSDTERAGATLQVNLDPGRMLIKDDLLNALIFLSDKIPAVHTIDLEKLVDKWLYYCSIHDIDLFGELGRNKQARSDLGKAVTKLTDEVSKSFKIWANWDTGDHRCPSSAKI